MKAVVDTCVRPASVAGVKLDSRCMVSKPSSKSDIDATEMSACFSKLRDLVPSIPQDRKISKTQLLQHVIDYILDLELALDSHPVVPGLKLCGMEAMESASARQPLLERCDTNGNMAEVRMSLSFLLSRRQRS